MVGYARVHCTCTSGSFQFTHAKQKYFLYIDTDECLVANGDCEHICTNTGGSRECSCEDGYRLGSDDQSCQGINAVTN